MLTIDHNKQWNKNNFSEPRYRDTLILTYVLASEMNNHVLLSVIINIICCWYRLFVPDMPFKEYLREQTKASNVHYDRTCAIDKYDLACPACEIF